METLHNTFDLAITVAAEDIDQLGHVNNVVYVRWVQEAAIAHWSKLATPDEQRRLLWLITRHEIDYKRQAFLGERLTARTWVGEADGLSFVRHTEILREGKVLARARTLWCPVDAKTMRPTEPGAEVRARFSSAPMNELSEDIF